LSQKANFYEQSAASDQFETKIIIKNSTKPQTNKIKNNLKMKKQL